MEILDTLPVRYEADFILWMQGQIVVLRERQFDALDLNNLIDELEDLVRHARKELASRLRIIMTHLLKWQCQPQMRSPSWRNTLAIQRDAFADLLDESRSLRRLLPDLTQKNFARAVRMAMTETGLPKRDFPAALPYTPEQLLDFDFYPEPVP
jgi:hypothetical protein